MHFVAAAVQKCFCTRAGKDRKGGFELIPLADWVVTFILIYLTFHKFSVCLYSGADHVGRPANITFLSNYTGCPKRMYTLQMLLFMSMG
jgi:hypothetical protein